MMKTTKHYKLGLIGFPLEHSLSPEIHQQFFRDTGISGDYYSFPIHPDRFDIEIQHLLRQLTDGSIHGLNVTIPYKQKIIQYMEELSAEADAVGAVNTVGVRDGKIIGSNTDVEGFMKDLKSVEMCFSHAFVLGAGGAARAVVFALSLMGISVTLCARREQQTKDLIHDLGKHLSAVNKIQFVDWHEQESIIQIIRGCDLVVNTTPIGMFPNIDKSPLFENCYPSAHFFSYDLVYNPLKTKFLAVGENYGLKTMTGLGMLVEQAGLSYKSWTGIEISQQTADKVKKSLALRFRNRHE